MMVSESNLIPSDISCYAISYFHVLMLFHSITILPVPDQPLCLSFVSLSYYFLIFKMFYHYHLCHITLLPTIRALSLWVQEENNYSMIDFVWSDELKTGELSLNVVAVKASVHLPFDHSLLVQNLTAQVIVSNWIWICSRYDRYSMPAMLCGESGPRIYLLSVDILPFHFIHSEFLYQMKLGSV